MEFVRAARGLLALVQQAVGELSAVSPFPYFLFSFPLVFCKSLRSFIAGLYRRHHLQHCFWLVVHLNYQVAFPTKPAVLRDRVTRPPDDPRHRPDDQQTSDIRSLKRPLTHAPIKIGCHAWVAAEAMILPGVTVGQGAVISARTVLRKDADDWSIWAGNPARRVGSREILDNVE